MLQRSRLVGRSSQWLPLEEELRQDVLTIPELGGGRSDPAWRGILVDRRGADRPARWVVKADQILRATAAS